MNVACWCWVDTVFIPVFTVIDLL